MNQHSYQHSTPYNTIYLNLQTGLYGTHKAPKHHLDITAAQSGCIACNYPPWDANLAQRRPTSNQLLRLGFSFLQRLSHRSWCSRKVKHELRWQIQPAQHHYRRPCRALREEQLRKTPARQYCKRWENMKSVQHWLWSLHTPAWVGLLFASRLKLIPELPKQILRSQNIQLLSVGGFLSCNPIASSHGHGHVSCRTQANE